MPSVPPAAIEPRNRARLYPPLSMLGIATVPMVAAVATEEPDVAAKIALAAMFVWISRPGMRANQGVSAENSRSLRPERCISSPIMMNIGAAIRMKSFEEFHASSPSAPTIGKKANFSERI